MVNKDDDTKVSHIFIENRLLIKQIKRLQLELCKNKDLEYASKFLYDEDLFKSSEFNLIRKNCELENIISHLLKTLKVQQNKGLNEKGIKLFGDKRSLGKKIPNILDVYENDGIEGVERLVENKFISNKEAASFFFDVSKRVKQINGQEACSLLKFAWLLDPNDLRLKSYIFCLYDNDEFVKLEALISLFPEIVIEDKIEEKIFTKIKKDIQDNSIKYNNINFILKQKIKKLIERDNQVKEENLKQNKLLNLELLNTQKTVLILKEFIDKIIQLELSYEKLMAFAENLKEKELSILGNYDLIELIKNDLLIFVKDNGILGEYINAFYTINLINEELKTNYNALDISISSLIEKIFLLDEKDISSCINFEEDRKNNIDKIKRVFYQKCNRLKNNLRAHYLYNLGINSIENELKDISEIDIIYKIYKEINHQDFDTLIYFHEPANKFSNFLINEIEKLCLQTAIDIKCINYCLSGKSSTNDSNESILTIDNLNSEGENLRVFINRIKDELQNFEYQKPLVFFDRNYDLFEIFFLIRVLSKIYYKIDFCVIFLNSTSESEVNQNINKFCKLLDLNIKNIVEDGLFITIWI